MSSEEKINYEKTMKNINSECNTYDNKDVCIPGKIVNEIGELVEINVKNKGKKEIMDEIKEKTGCKTESCVLSKESISEKIDGKYLKEKYLKTKGPRKEFKWLNNENIDITLKHWENKFSGFKMCKFAMIDFEKKGDELSKICPTKLLNENFETFGCIINTDPSTKKGEHWMALFIDMRIKNNITIEFFNSTGDTSDGRIIHGYKYSEIHIWLKKMLKDLIYNNYKNINIHKIVSVQHQHKDGECGVYSLYYIWSRLNNVPISDFENPFNIITDEQMSNFRNFLFREND